MKRIVLLLTCTMLLDRPALGEECASPRAVWWQRTHSRETLGGSLNNPPLTTCVVKRLPRFSASTRIKGILCQELDDLYRAIDECWRDLIAQTWQEEHRDQSMQSAVQDSMHVPLSTLLQACELKASTKVAELKLPQIRCILIYIDE